MTLKSPKPTFTIRQLNQIQALIITNPQPHILNPLLKTLTQSSNPQPNAPRLHHPLAYNHFTSTHALQACTHHKGLEIHASVIKCGHLHGLFIQNSLIHFYCVTKNDIFSAHKIFNSLLYPDVVSWTTIISGLSKCGFFREAIDMFAAMNVKPNCNTLVSVISACPGLRSLKFGKAIHGYSFRIFHEDNVILENAVLDFYVRCSLAMNGYGKLALLLFSLMIVNLVLKLFSLMIVNLVRPDDITFTGLLSACSHGGMVDEGFMIFKAMSVYKIDMETRECSKGLSRSLST
ncbi:hypothetical protein Q3G72_025517 [Acer saccharum]|nr:hypothetical protein Q3G72_025517 [Acer saccharum]